MTTERAETKIARVSRNVMYLKHSLGVGPLCGLLVQARGDKILKVLRPVAYRWRPSASVSSSHEMSCCIRTSTEAFSMFTRYAPLALLPKCGRLVPRDHEECTHRVHVKERRFQVGHLDGGDAQGPDVRLENEESISFVSEL